jgi:hypothetical protein
VGIGFEAAVHPSRVRGEGWVRDCGASQSCGGRFRAAVHPAGRGQGLGPVLRCVPFGLVAGLGRGAAVRPIRVGYSASCRDWGLQCAPAELRVAVGSK